MNGNAIVLNSQSIPETDVPRTVTALREGTTQIVDVREPDEWAEGHMPGIRHIPLGDLAGRLGELDPSILVIAFCRSGKRSLTATDILIKRGFTDAKGMAGGMIAWSASGEPIEQ